MSGAPAGARVAFLRKKLRKNLFGKRFLAPHWVGANMAVPMPEGARPVFAEGKDRQRFAFLWVGPFFFGRGNICMFEESFKLGFIGVFG